MRTKKEEVIKTFEQYCIAMNKREAQSYHDVGAWRLCYSGLYGGWLINEIDNESGGISGPLGYVRHTSKEFVALMRFAIESIRIKK